MNRNMSLKSAVMGAALLLGLGTASAFAQQSGDAALANQVKAAFSQESQLNGTDLAIRVQDGRITLFGSATEAQAAEAYREAISVPGVKSVSNFISMTDLSG